MSGVHDFLDAFWELSADRQLGMSIGPIPAASIDRWADRFEYHLDEYYLFRKLIRAMDHVYLEHVNSKDGSNTSNAPPREPVSSRPLSSGLFDALFPTKPRKSKA